MAKKKILEDGSVEGETFSGPAYKGEYPSPKVGERYREYRERVDEAKAKGFHLGDLSWDDWRTYCMGSGQYAGVDSGDRIE